MIQHHSPKKRYPKILTQHTISYCIDNNGKQLNFKNENEDISSATNRIFKSKMEFNGRNELHAVGTAFASV